MSEMQETPAAETPAEAPKGRFFSEEELQAAIEQARKQEKDKLYPQIQKTDERWTALNDEVKELRKKATAAEKAEAERLAAIEAERKKREEAEMSAKEFAEKVRAEAEAKFAQLQQQQEMERAMYQQDLKVMQLQNHIQRRLAEESENIAPELIDYITGSDIDEIEASIEKAKAKTAAIVQGIQQARVAQRAAMPGVAPAAGTNGVGPMDTPGDRQYTAEDIQKMGPAEYKAFREKIGLNRLQAGSTGLFGM